jgi:hypothetical protein
MTRKESQPAKKREEAPRAKPAALQNLQSFQGRKMCGVFGEDKGNCGQNIENGDYES